uniref:Uncharacterized protein n=1 Tax=Magallana gigas TaxID=29159 RepID=K1P0M6_MAGGI
MPHRLLTRYPLHTLSTSVLLGSSAGMCGDCFHWKMQQYVGIHRKLSLKSLILSVLWINAYSWSWFEAKDMCESNGTVIGTTSNSINHSWTKYYHRRSHWISTLEPITKQSDALSNSTCIAMSCDTEQTEDDLIERKDCKKVCSESVCSTRLSK